MSDIIDIYIYMNPTSFCKNKTPHLSKKNIQIIIIKHRLQWKVTSKNGSQRFSQQNVQRFAMELHIAGPDTFHQVIDLHTTPHNWRTRLPGRGARARGGGLLRPLAVWRCWRCRRFGGWRLFGMHFFSEKNGENDGKNMCPPPKIL